MNNDRMTKEEMTRMLETISKSSSDIAIATRTVAELNRELVRLVVRSAETGEKQDIAQKYALSSSAPDTHPASAGAARDVFVAQHPISLARRNTIWMNPVNNFQFPISNQVLMSQFPMKILELKIH